MRTINPLDLLRNTELGYFDHIDTNNIVYYHYITFLLLLLDFIRNTTDPSTGHFSNQEIAL